VSDWNKWEVVRRQVAVAGRVMDEHDEPVAGALVTLTLLPKEGRPRRARAGTDQQKPDERCDRTVTKADGIFFFLDSPAGEYSVECLNGRSGLRDRKTVSVSWKQGGNVERVLADLKLLRPKGEDSKIVRTNN
jgi:hypothetical protein